MMSTLIILQVNLLPSKWVRHAQPMMATLVHVKLRCAAHHGGTTHGLFAKETPPVIQIVFRPGISDAVAFVSNLRDMRILFASRPPSPGILNPLPGFALITFDKNCSETQGPDGPWVFIKISKMRNKNENFNSNKLSGNVHHSG